MIRLSQAQRKIVESPTAQSIQVLASAGSGKTRVLTERVRFILENTKKEGAIALTFTNKAAEEMRSRLLDCDGLKDRAWIATVHSVAQRIVERYGHVIGLPGGLHIYERDKDRMEVFLQSLRDDWVDIDEYLEIDDAADKRSRERVLQSYMEAFSRIKKEFLTEENIEERFPEKPDLWKMFQDYKTALLNSGGIDYDDLLVYGRELLLKHRWIAGIYGARYNHLCVDEAQDLNLAQYEFIKALCGDLTSSVMMVGDPNQMIYGFNGSSSVYLCEHFVRDFSPVRYELKENYRSTRKIIKAANKLRPKAQMEHDFALDGKFSVKSLSDETEEAKWIVSSIKKFVGREHADIEGRISLDHMAVIARNRFAFSSLEEVLNENSIPFTLAKGERNDGPESLFGKILDYGIRIKLNPRDWVDGRRLCNLLEFEYPDEWKDANILKHWAGRMTGENGFAKLHSDLLTSIHQLDSENPNIAKFEKLFEGRLEELDQTETDGKNKFELERSAEELKEFGRRWTIFRQKGLGKSLRSFGNALALGQLTEDVQPNGLTLSTVHSMKGLEKDIVFIMCMCEGVFPDYRSKSEKQIDEERNNAFVAVTRARRWLFMTYPEKRTMPWGEQKHQTESRFVKEIGTRESRPSRLKKARETRRGLEVVS